MYIAISLISSAVTDKHKHMKQQSTKQILQENRNSVYFENALKRLFCVISRNLNKYNIYQTQTRWLKSEIECDNKW